MESQPLWGVLFGLLSAFFIGLFMVPRRYVLSDSVTFVVAMTAGSAAANSVYWLVMGRPFVATPAALVTLLPGAVWAVGSYAYAAGAHRIGLAKASAIKNTQLVVTTAGGFLIFNEAATTQPALACLGGAFVIATALIMSNTEHSGDTVPHASLTGYLVPIVASVLYGINGLLMKWLISHGVPQPEINLGIGLGGIATGLALFAAVKRRINPVDSAAARHHAFAFVGGVIWAAGLVAMLKAIEYAGVAVGWALMNLSVVISVSYGVVVLREISVRKQWRRVAVGLLMALCGIGALSLSKYVMAR